MKTRRLAGLALSALLASACGDDTGTTTTTTSTGSGGAGGGATTSATGGQGTGGAELDGPGPGETCDVMAQNCADPTAPKCTLDFSDPAALPSTCEESLGTDALGDACERPGEMPGIDTCAPGLYCSAIGHPATSPPERECRTMCDAPADCPQGFFCSRFNGGQLGPDTRLVGLCAPECEFFDASTCSTANTKCLSTAKITGEPGFTCFAAGAADIGGTCANNNDCKALLGCDLSVMKCVAFCDATHGCAQFTACELFPNQPIGACRGAPAAWVCDPQQYADGTNCDCDCGAVDPDCTDTALPVVGCTDPDVCKNGNCVPPTWTCNGAWFDSADGCDCNCGLEDPDCSKPNMMTLGCQMGQTCVAGVCQ